MNYLNERIKVIDQEIYGKCIVEYDTEIFIEEEDAETLDDQLFFKKSEVEIIEESDDE